MTGWPDGAATADLMARLARHDRDGDEAALLDAAAQERALRLYRETLARRDPVGDAVALSVLGRWFLRRYRMLPIADRQADLRAARLCAGLLQDAARQSASGPGPAVVLPAQLRELLAAPPDLATRTAETAHALLADFDQTGDARQVAAAAGLLDAVPAEPAPAEPGMLASASRLAESRFALHADPAELDAMVAARRAALAVTGADLESVTVLAGALLMRYEFGASTADLEEAEQLLGDLLSDTGQPPPAVAATVASVLRVRFERSLDVAPLDRGVELCRTALAALPTGDPGRASLLEATSFLLLRRYIHLGHEPDLAAAIEAAQALEALSGDGGRLQLVAQWNLTTLLLLRAHRTRSAADAAAALARSSAAVARSEGLTAYRHTILMRHAGVLYLRHMIAGHRADLDEAIRYARLAVAAAPPGPLHLGEHQAVLASLLIMSAADGGPAADLDEAVALGRAAVQTAPDGHPLRVKATAVLAHAHLLRHAATGDPADLDAATRLGREAASSGIGLLEDRTMAAGDWVTTSLRRGDLAGATEAASLAVSLLPMLVGRGVDRHGQEQRLASVGGLPALAVALEIELRRPERAVERSEQGRTVLWEQAAEVRGDLSALAAAAPELADQLDRTRRELLRLGAPAAAGVPDVDPAAAGAPGAGASGAGVPGADPAADPHRRLARYRELAGRWDRLLAAARALPGFAGFLGTAPFATLQAAAGDGAVVVVNATDARSDAIVVRAGSVEVVPLPWLTRTAARERVRALHDALADTGGPVAAARWADVRQTLGALLRWLWDVVAAPVLAQLDAAEPGRTQPHRVWWCPTGPLSLLPLHAAGRYGSAGRWAGQRRPTVPDRTVSSYTINLRALLRARQRSAPGGTPAVLAVGMPQTPGHAPLPAVTAELDRIAAAVPGTRRLIGPAATPAAVLAELDRYAWLHLACHATARTDRPGDSALHLTGGDLTVLRLADRQVAGADLAYLSACHTAGGSPVLADEAVHLAAALQLVGYRHVIGTLWSVADTHAAAVADQVYATLTEDGRPQAEHAARALRAATAALREQYPDRPELWAAYVHFGP